MSFFNRPHYTSDITNFIQEMMTKRPSLEAEQRAGRALLWDKQVNGAQLEDYDEGNIPQQPYVYQTQSD